MREHKKIDYVEIPTRDIDATKAFFHRVFGWKFKDYGPDYTCFYDQGLNGGFYSSDKAASSDNGTALIVFYSDDIDRSLQEIEAAGGEVVKLTFEFPGGRRFHFSEPGGNEFGVWSDKGS